MKRLVLLAAVLILPLCGCSAASGVAKKLKGDPAIVVVKLATPWGPQSVVRIGGQTNNSVTINLDGSITITPMWPTNVVRTAVVTNAP